MTRQTPTNVNPIFCRFTSKSLDQDVYISTPPPTSCTRVRGLGAGPIYELAHLQELAHSIGKCGVGGVDPIWTRMCTARRHLQHPDTSGCWPLLGCWMWTMLHGLMGHDGSWTMGHGPIWAPVSEPGKNWVVIFLGLSVHFRRQLKKREIPKGWYYFPDRKGTSQ